MLGEDHPDYALAVELGKKTRDISEFLMMIGLNTEQMRPLPMKTPITIPVI